MGMAAMEKIDQEQRKTDGPSDFAVGDTVRVHVRIKEGDKERVQVYTGDVIARKGAGATETFTVRRISFGEGVERIFPVHSPNVARVEVQTRGSVRRAKLYYLRERSGKAARVKAKARSTSTKEKK